MNRNGAALAGRPGRHGASTAAVAAPTLRCGIYCRKSVEERHATDFGSIDAQREACEAFVRSQKGLGWNLLPTRYDDEGYSGANTDRPAMARLLRDVEAGLIDVVVVYKIDRLSRSIGDFVRLTETFDRHGVAFVSVTQQFNTTTSAGRLTLNLLTVFAQFERETISERTRDKMRAARRRGKYTGGPPILGFDRHPQGRRLVVNEAEAGRVRALFDLFLATRSVVAVVQEANARGWTTKARTTARGRAVPGRRVTAGYVRALLANPAYPGLVRIEGEAFPAEHEAILPREVFEKAQALLRPGRPPRERRRHSATPSILRGLLRCQPCDAAMVPSHTRKGSRLYAYYRCQRAQEEGWSSCPSPSVPAREIERLVVDQIRVIGQDPDLQARTLEATRAMAPEIAIDPADLRRVLTLWDDVWAALLPPEQARVLALLVERVGYDGAAGTVAVTFHPTGIRALAREAGS